MPKLLKRNILKKNRQFQIIYRHGRSYANRAMVLYVLRNHSDLQQIGFVAGKKAGPAVVRNRIKRLFREVYRQNQHSLKQGIQLIVVGRQSAVPLKYSQFEKAFLDLCRKAKLIKVLEKGE